MKGVQPHDHRRNQTSLPDCGSDQLKRNGFTGGKQKYKCKTCGRYGSLNPQQSYSQECAIKYSAPTWSAPASVGGRGADTCQKLKQNIPPAYSHAQTVSDFWEAYKPVLGEDHRCVGKDSGETAHVEH